MGGGCGVRRGVGKTRYAELHCLSNFSFLRGASHPEELVARAAELGYAALAITDRNSLAGVVRAYRAAREHGLHLIIGAEITPLDGPPLVLLATDRASYGRLCRLITRGRLRSPKGECAIRMADVGELAGGLVAIVDGGALPEWASAAAGEDRRDSVWGAGLSRLEAYREIFGDRLYLSVALDFGEPDEVRLGRLADLSAHTGIPLVATNRVLYHVPQRRCLQDALTCIRERCTLAEAGRRLLPNAERHLRPLEEIGRRYGSCGTGRLARIGRGALARTVEIADRCTFRLDELRYSYPHELTPPGRSAMEHLSQLVWSGARERYGGPVPPKVQAQIEAELRLIAELRYEHYFLTVWDLCRLARSRGILCQGRGSAANSAVCYALGITAVDPQRSDLLFERFISRERNEPPDIDVDFEHQRREEVFQYIYDKYGRERAGITAEVITYRPRLAVRDMGRVLGLSLDRIDVLAAALDGFHDRPVPESALSHAGLDPRERTVRLLAWLVRQVLGFPRHLSQHVGGFVITETPLCEMVPLENGAMPGRTFIEWDKDDIDTLGLLKVDCLALGMLTAISRCLTLLDRHGGASAPRSLHQIPPEDPAVYDMIARADTLGVFQIESRAQMSMLPRLEPRCFYDLVIQVAIVRPGPIQGGMVHPYLRRRRGLEPVTYPSEAVRQVLEKTLGVPLFQEQVMRLAVVAAGFTPGEADQLRRAMGTWRHTGRLQQLQLRLMQGLLAHGYSREYAEQLYRQISGFGEYGFPESHAASFALLVYASAWLKCYYPAAFCAALLNSQPLGFYTPGQLIRDAAAHGVTVLPVDVNFSEYDCTLETTDGPSCVAPGAACNGQGAAGPHPVQTAPDRMASLPGPQPPRSVGAGPALRLGLRLVRGMSPARAAGIIAARRTGPIVSIRQLARRGDVSRDTLLRLAAADAFRSLGLARREALWRILALERDEVLRGRRSEGRSGDRPGAGQGGLFDDLEPVEASPRLPEPEPGQTVAEDYEALGFSLHAHPMALIREALEREGPGGWRSAGGHRILRAVEVQAARSGRRVALAGLVTVRQRPGTARGIVFMTLEDETGMTNLIVRPSVWERYWRIARTSPALIAEGTIERQGRVVHVLVSHFQELPGHPERLHHVSRDFH